MKLRKRIATIGVVMVMAAFCLLATSCSQKSNIVDVDDPSSTVDVSSEMPETSSGSIDNSSDIVAEPQGNDNTRRLKSDWSNWADGTLSSAYGMQLNLMKGANDGSILTDDTVFDEDGISLHLIYSLDLDEFKTPDDAVLTVLVFVNDKVCDFSLGEQKSESGMLTTNSEVNKQLVTPLTISDCDLIKGDNKISVFMAVYFAQTGHSSSVEITRHFQSKRSKTQTADIAAPDRHEDEIKYFDSSDKSVLGQSLNFIVDPIRIEQSNRCSYVKPGTDVVFRFINSNQTQNSGAKRTVVCFALENGKPVTLFNDKKYAIVPLNETNFAFDLTIMKLDKQAAYSHITFVVFNIDEEVDCYYSSANSERLFYTDAQG